LDLKKMQSGQLGQKFHKSRVGSDFQTLGEARILMISRGLAQERNSEACKNRRSVAASINRGDEFCHSLRAPTFHRLRPSHSFAFAGSAVGHWHSVHHVDAQKLHDSDFWSDRQKIVWFYPRFLSFPPDLVRSRAKVYSGHFPVLRRHLHFGDWLVGWA